MPNTTCCFFGHRNVSVTEELKKRLAEIIEGLITDENVDTFLFGSKSSFDSLCLDTVTELKEKYPHVRRVYVRAEFPDIDDGYRSYLLQLYEDTYYPERLRGAGRAVYVERNREMVDRSLFCIVYYREDSLPERRSGTALALNYAVKKRRKVIII